MMAFVNYDRDALPPLEDCSGYLLAQQHGRNLPTDSTKTGSKRDSTSLADPSNDNCAFLKIVSTTQDKERLSKHQTSQITSKSFRKGFFNNKPSSGGKAKWEDVPFIKACNKIEKVPEFLKLDLKNDAQEQFRKEMKDLMKPTQDLVTKVLSNKEIQTGLEDPEIMMAVQDIASNPSAMHKYKHHPKIVNFYNSLGKLMGNHIENEEREKNKRDDSKYTNF